jgi:hypothetical protein
MSIPSTPDPYAQGDEGTEGWKAGLALELMFVFPFFCANFVYFLTSIFYFFPKRFRFNEKKDNFLTSIVLLCSLFALRVNLFM